MQGNRPVLRPAPNRACPLCETTNPPHESLCEGCGFHLNTSLPPWIWDRRTQWGALVGGVLLAMSVLLIFANWLVPGDESITTARDRSPTTNKNDSAAGNSGEPAPVEARPLVIASVSASSSDSAALGPASLIDGDPATYWNDRSHSGEGAELTFEFGERVDISKVVVHNLSDRVLFRRNYRIRGYEMITDTLATPLVGELEDSQEPQTLTLESTRATTLTIRVTSTYAGEPVEDEPHLHTLGLAEVVVYGTPSDSP